eukprot:19956-Heterococcus_DN1.PRE.3
MSAQRSGGSGSEIHNLDSTLLITLLNKKAIIMYTASVAALAALPLASAFVAPTGFTGNALARDPLGLAASVDDQELQKYREAEVKHGR